MAVIAAAVAALWLLWGLVFWRFGRTRDPASLTRKLTSWLLAGSMPVDEMAELLSIAVSPERSFHTAAGFALDHLGYLPRVGETFESQGWRFEIVDLDGRRIDQILATRTTGGLRRAGSDPNSVR